MAVAHNPTRRLSNHVHKGGKGGSPVKPIERLRHRLATSSNVLGVSSTRCRDGPKETNEAEREPRRLCPVRRGGSHARTQAGLPVEGCVRWWLPDGALGAQDEPSARQNQNHSGVVSRCCFLDLSVGVGTDGTETEGIERGDRRWVRGGLALQSGVDTAGKTPLSSDLESYSEAPYPGNTVNPRLSFSPI